MSGTSTPVQNFITMRFFSPNIRTKWRGQFWGSSNTLQPSPTPSLLHRFLRLVCQMA